MKVVIVNMCVHKVGQILVKKSWMIVWIHNIPGLLASFLNWKLSSFTKVDTPFTTCSTNPFQAFLPIRFVLPLYMESGIMFRAYAKSDTAFSFLTSVECGFNDV